MAIAPLLGRTTGRITLDQKQFGLGRIAFLAIGELAGQRGDIHHALAPGQFARFLGGFARGSGVDDLADNGFGVLRGFPRAIQPSCRPSGFPSAGVPRTRRACPWSGELNLGSGNLTDTIAVSPSRISSPVSWLPSPF